LCLPKTNAWLLIDCCTLAKPTCSLWVDNLQKVLSPNYLRFPKTHCLPFQDSNVANSLEIQPYMKPWWISKLNLDFEFEFLKFLTLKG
jgi:hypothetical protein